MQMPNRTPGYFSGYLITDRSRNSCSHAESAVSVLIHFCLFEERFSVLRLPTGATGDNRAGIKLRKKWKDAGEEEKKRFASTAKV